MSITNTHHHHLRTPHHQTGDKAIVLGAREGNIGGAIAQRLCRSGWIAVEDDCHRPLMAPIEWEQNERFFCPEYNPPLTHELEPYDACIITLGTTHMAPFSEVSRKDLRKVLYGSLELPLECARRYVRARIHKLMKCDICGEDCRNADIHCGHHPPKILSGNKHSTIIFIGSYAHNHPFTHCTSYCVAKAGLDMAAKSLAWELMPEGFDVHIIHPHHVQGTPMTDVVLEDMQKGVHRMTPEQAREYQLKDLRMPRLLKPEDIAEMVRLILFEPAMRWVSGTGVEMYGGVR